MTEAVAVRPVEEWVELFRHFSDEQVLRPDFAVMRRSVGPWCKLCDAGIVGAVDRHLAQHARDLKAYRARGRRRFEQRRDQMLAVARRERAMTARVLEARRPDDQLGRAEAGAVEPDNRETEDQMGARAQRKQRAAARSAAKKTASAPRKASATRRASTAPKKASTAKRSTAKKSSASASMGTAAGRRANSEARQAKKAAQSSPSPAAATDGKKPSAAVACAIELLKKSGGEMKVSELAAQVVSSGKVELKGKTPAATVGAQIYVAAKAGRWFRKTQRGMVALAT